MQLDITALTKPLKQPLATSESAFDTLVPDSVVKDLRSALFSMRSDDRADWVRIGIALKTLGDQGRGLWLEWSSTSPKFDLRDAVEVWETFRPTQTGYQAVFAEASRQGWLNPSKHVDSQLGFDSLGDTVAEISGVLGEKIPPVNPYVFKTAREIVGSEPLEWLVDSWLPKADVGMCFGKTGTGKSLEIFDMVMAMERGTPWQGYDTRKTKTAMVVAEGGKGLGMRFDAYSIANGVPIDDFNVISLTAAPNLMSKVDADFIIASLKDSGIELLIVDTFSATFCASENDAEAISMAMREYRRIGKELGGIMILAIHHEGKQTGNGSRGSSAIKAAMDVELHVTMEEGSDMRSIKTTKMKDGADNLPPINFQLSYVVTGFDRRGKPIVSCVCDHGSV